MTVPYPAALTWLRDLTLLLSLSLSVSLSRFPPRWIYLSQTFRRVPKIVLRSFRTNDMKRDPQNLMPHSLARLHVCIYVRWFFSSPDWLVREEYVFFMCKNKGQGKAVQAWRACNMRNPLAFKGDSLLTLDVQKKTHWICQSLWQVATTPQPWYWFTSDLTLFLNFKSWWSVSL